MKVEWEGEVKRESEKKGVERGLSGLRKEKRAMCHSPLEFGSTD